MNQILSTSMPIDNKRKRSKQPVDLGSILRFFGIAILIFGIFIVGTGVYAICINQNDKSEQSLDPVISIENKTATSIMLKVTHNKNIEKIEYGWNNNAGIIINGNNGRYLEKEIELPAGTNTLKVLVQDEEGKEITYEKQYVLESNINFEVLGNKIKITYSGDKLISYMTYRWDEEEENRINVNDKNIEQEIDALRGLHTLTVIVVDEDNNTDTKSQKINGVSKPKVILDVDNQVQHFVIKASDDEKLMRIEFRLNEDEEQEYILNLEDKDMKELEYVLPMELQEGDNILEVTVYNSNGISTESAVKFVK